MAEAILPQVAAPALQRSVGETRVSFRRRGELTVLDDLLQSGCGKVRFPRSTTNAPPEAVLINTAGGLTDGDIIRNTAQWQKGAAAIVTTQAAERIYRSRGENARIETRIEVSSAASAVWLPQETIVFDGGRFSRSTEIEMAADASLLAVESIVFGRTAMGEQVDGGAVYDNWRLRIDGALVFADGLAIDDATHGSVQQTLNHPAVADGGHVIAAVLLVTPGAERYVQPLREVLGEGAVMGGVSCLGALVTMRLVARDASDLRSTMIRVFNAIKSLQEGDNRFAPFSVPRVFSF